VGGQGFGQDTAQAIIQGLQARLGRGVQVDVEPVDQIAPEQSGKYRFVISKVTV